MDEPRYLLVDTKSGKEVKITTDELQALIWRMEIQQPLDEAYFERSTNENATRRQ